MRRTQITFYPRPDNFHEVYNVEKWEIVEYGKHVEIKTFQIFKCGDFDFFGNFCSTSDGLLKLITP